MSTASPGRGHRFLTIDCEFMGNLSVIRAPVSFGNEELILVDGDDCVVGHSSKLDAHAGLGMLHRAFSVFLFDDQGRLLVHRRSEKKPLWPGFWTNSCCSHPRKGESLESAVKRRITEELGVVADPVYVYKFEYHVAYEDRGSEHELCHVFLATIASTEQISAHADEVMEWRWLSTDEVDVWMMEKTASLTPWFRQEWQALRDQYRPRLETFIASSKKSKSHLGAA
ncbi:MAG: isopentenyl-diphosphate Delta-isomerase [Congregibacter sp.]|nr:isopentenyl-diphosphate Delta-isomerase [Congregibacter sp.]